MLSSRTLLCCLSLLLACSINANAQVPQGINYQGVARSATGVVLANQQLTIKISIVQNSPNGTVEYAEKQVPYTNQ